MHRPDTEGFRGGGCAASVQDIEAPPRGVVVVKLGLSLSGVRGLHLSAPKKGENRVETW